jgi:4-methylaminobutanoate oxidase (formaldehyde-forming)
LTGDGIAAAMRVGDDMYFNPAQVAIGFARGAASRGATLLPNTRATRVVIDAGRVAGVETDRGTIRTPVVVDAAGAWTRQMAEASGLRIPLVPTRHQLFVTAPIDGVRPDLPMVRIMDAAVYVRPCDGGLLWGVFEEGPRFLDMETLGPRFDIKDTPLDAGVLRRAAADVRAEMPVLETAVVREHRGGIPTMTPDGEHIVGPAPAADGFFFASGCNVAGLSISPALGEALAAWINDGRPPIDLSELSPARFGERRWAEDQLQRDAAWQYHHFYGAV